MIKKHRYIHPSILLVLFYAFLNAQAEEMTELELFMIERECERLCILYTRYVDFGEAEKVTDLFVDDGVWESSTMRADGKAEIRVLFKDRQNRKDRVSRHLVTNQMVEVIDRNNAKGTSYILLFRHDGNPSEPVRPLADQPIFVGQYEDEYVKSGGVWLFKRRKATGPFRRQN